MSTKTRNALIHDTITSHLGPCDFSGKRCVTHESRAEGPLCIVVIDALDAASEAVQAVLADLLRQAKELAIVEPEYPAIHDAVDRDEVLRLLGGAR